MARKRPTPSATKPVITCSPAWAWFFAGILIGIVISFVFYFHEIAPNRLPDQTANITNTMPVVATVQENPVTPETKSSTEKVKSDNHFEFYDVLPNGGVKKTTPIMIEEPADAEEIGAIDLSPVQAPGTYLLQVGSFKDARGAGALQTYLATLNVRTYIQQATVKEANGAEVLWHRVMAGPFTDLNLLNQTRNTLAVQNIYTIVLNVTTN